MQLSRAIAAVRALPHIDLKKASALLLLGIALFFIYYPSPKRPVYTLETLTGLQFDHPAPSEIIQTLKIETAYAMTHVKYRPFDPAISTIPKEEAFYLKQVFDVVDTGIIERVQWFSFLSAGKTDFSAVAYNHREILRRLDTMRVPAGMELFHQLLLHAVHEEYTYFNQWRSTPGMRFSATHPLVQSSNNKLLQAYSTLLQRYPDEDAYNRKAFYSHLCALSFI